MSVPKQFACICNLLVLAVFSGLCNYFTAILPLGGLEQREAVFTTTLGLLLTGLTLFAITLLASSLTRTYKGAIRIGAGILLLFYGISITAEYLEIPMLYCLTPLKFFDIYTVANCRYQRVSPTSFIIRSDSISVRPSWSRSTCIVFRYPARSVLQVSPIS